MACFDNPLNRACSALHSFRTPICRNTNGLDFSASFLCSTTTPESSALVTNLNNLRKQMCGELASPTSTNSMRLSCVDAYLPHVCNLLDSLNQQPPVALEKQLIFEWVGSFSQNALVFNQSSEIIFELGMVLHTKSILHYMVAYDMLQGDIISNVTLAGQNLRIAAGIMRHLAVDLLPKWLGANGKAGRPLELIEEVCLAYEQLFTASAQQMAVVKAMTKVGGTPVALLTKLVLGVSSIVTGNYDPSNLQMEVKNHYSYMRELFLAIAYKYQAETYSAKTEVGTAIAYAKRSQRHLTEQTGKTYMLNLPGLPSATLKGHNCPAYLSAARVSLNSELTLLVTDCEKNNKMVYFQQVPAVEDLPDMPAAHIFMAPIPFVPPALPESGPIIFTYDASRKPSFLKKMGIF